MLERGWELTRTIGGVLLVAEIVVFVMGSAHSGHLLRNSREFGRAFDEVTGSIVREIGNGAQWVAGKRQ
jgi:hypothetical protein